MVWKESFTILGSFTDFTDHLALWALGHIFQDVADNHTRACHVGFEDLKAQNKAWVLCRMFYRIDRLPAVNEKVEVSTWSSGVSGLFATREFRMTDANGIDICAATSYWVVIDFTTRHAIRLGNVMDNFEHHPELPATCAQLNKMKIAAFSGEEPIAVKFDIRSSMLDHTQHVNNTEYLRWFTDAVAVVRGLDFSLEGHSVTINFVNETHFGEWAQACCKEEEDILYCRITNNRGTAATVRLDRLQ